MQPCRLHITGASGSGTTTLGRAIADSWSVPHADSDDYYWIPTSPPFAVKRPVPERIGLMRAVFAPRSSWVLSGSADGWGDEIIALCDAVVLLTMKPSARLERLERREVEQRGVRTSDPSYREFRDWAASYDDPAFSGRARHRHEQWAAALEVPVLRLDAAPPVEDLVAAVLSWEPGA